MRGRFVLSILVGWLVVAPFAGADIVWSGDMYLRAFHDIPSLDFNKDGTSDIVFNSVYESGHDLIWIQPTNGQSVVADDPSLFYQTAIAFNAGISITSDLNDSDYTWAESESLLFVHGYVAGSENLGGPFAETDGYLGTAFNVDGSTYYGWIRMSHDGLRPSPEDDYLYVHSWAWETEADTPIVTGAIPEPSSSALVVFGALSLWQLRRSRRRKYCLTPGR